MSWIITFEHVDLYEQKFYLMKNGPMLNQMYVFIKSIESNQYKAELT